MRVEISPGASDGKFTEITGADIAEGLEVIVESLKSAKRGGRKNTRWRFL